MAFPTNEQELRAGLDKMKAGGATPQEMKLVIDKFVSTQKATPTEAPAEPSFLQKTGTKLLGKGLDMIPGIGAAKKTAEVALKSADKVVGQEESNFEPAEVLNKTVSGIKDIPQGIKQGFQEAQESTQRRSEVMNPIAEEKGVIGEGAMKIGTGILNTLDYASKILGGAVAPLVNPVIQETIQSLSPEAQEALNQNITNITQKFEALTPEQQEAIRGTGLLAEALTGGIAAPYAKQGVKTAVKTGAEAIEAGVDLAKQAPRFIEDTASAVKSNLGQKVDTTLAKFRDLPADNIPELETQRNVLTQELSDNFYEALPTDYKRDLLEAKPLVDDYMKTFTQSLQSTTTPTIMEKGANKLTNAINTIEGKIKATGNEIGDFREKISTIQVQPVRLDPVLQKFDSNLAKFGLKYENGAIKEVSGRKTKLTPSEVKQLEAMRGDLIDIKESPTAQMIVDVRSKIDSDINFAKDRRDISSNLDGIAKSTRADLAEVNREVIGREQSGLLERYSDLNDLVTEYRKASGKGKNLEFFLKRIMSERGRTPKGIVERIKKETGTDLTQDAIVIDAITSYLAPQRMKGRFQQEIASAGLDAGTIISGIVNPVGAVKDIAAKTFVNKMIKRFTDTPLQKTWEKLLKNDEAMLELEKVLKETTSLDNTDLPEIKSPMTNV